MTGNNTIPNQEHLPRRRVSQVQQNTSPCTHSSIKKYTPNFHLGSEGNNLVQIDDTSWHANIPVLTLNAENKLSTLQLKNFNNGASAHTGDTNAVVFTHRHT